MKCKNCGAELPEHANMCFNCGTNPDEAKDFVLLSDIYEDSDGTVVEENHKIESVERKERRKRRRNMLLFVIFTVVLITASAVGSLAYFNAQNAKKEIPELTFTTGYGLINDDESIVYASFDDPIKVEYIQGVSIYGVDDSGSKSNLISNDYEYTKSVNTSFRAIYFDMDKLDIKGKGEHNYIFEISVSFYSDENIFTYQTPVTIKGKAKKDVSEIIFDHTIKNENIIEKPQIDSEANITDVEYSFIFNGDWSTDVVEDRKGQNSTTYRFSEAGTGLIMHYNKAPGKEWKCITDQMTYSLKNDELTIVDATDEAYNVVIVVDTSSQTLYVKTDRGLSQLTQS